MDLGEVDRITADAVGEPGKRTFYIQARAGDQVVTVIAEKEQVVLLATSVLELLADVALETGPASESMGLEEPLDPLWRVGRLSIGYDSSQDRFLLEITEQVPLEEGESEAPETEEADLIRLTASREQMLALSRHGAEVAERGRPACPLCGNPMDPEGHECPATNGHRKPRP